MYETKPWLKFYGNIPVSIDYPGITLYEAVRQTVAKYPQATAYDFFDFTATYQEFAQDIDRCAEALSDLGLKSGDRITIAMPTCPPGIICFYAAIKIGAVTSMIHPLSPPKEIEFYLKVSQSRLALTLDMFYQNFRQGMTGTACDKLILARIPDYLPPLKKLFFWLGKGRKIAKVPPDPGVIWWSAMMHRNYPPVAAAPADPDEMAVILYSGGTTGVPKGIMLSHRNFISEGMMVASWSGLSPEEHAKGKVLAALPIFHGFGLGVCVNSVFMGGGTSILVPTFTPESVARLIKKKKPTFVIGVPTLYEALCRNPQFRKTDLSCLKGTFSGADTLSRALKEEFESVCRQAGGSIKLLEGYGLTEAVTAVMAMPLNEYREGSVGIPFPDMLAKIVEPGTTKEAATGQEGEICLHGPAVMLGYLDQPEETANVLQKHADGQIWLHTGDLATMDEDGFVYFKQRLKRMIKSSGMNVYPGQVEEILRQHAEVAQACVIGVPDLKQGERVKGFVVLRNPDRAGPEMERELIAHSARYLIKWSCPREIEFRPDLPKTLVGKIAFHVLEQEARAKEQE